MISTLDALHKVAPVASDVGTLIGAGSAVVSTIVAVWNWLRCRTHRRRADLYSKLLAAMSAENKTLRQAIKTLARPVPREQ